MPKRKNLLDSIKSSGGEKKAVHHISSWVITLLFSLIGLGIIVTAFVFGFPALYKDKIFPGTRVGDLIIGGKTASEARQLLQARIDQITDRGFSFSYNNAIFKIGASIGDSTNPELAVPVVSLDAGKTVDNILKIQAGRNEVEKIYYWLTGNRISAVNTIDDKRFTEQLDEQLGSKQQPALDAKLVINTDGTLSVSPEKGGQAFNYPKIISQVKNQLDQLNGNTINLVLEADSPAITKMQGEKLLDLARQIIDSAPFSLIYSDHSWELSKENVQDWLELQQINGQAGMGLNSASLGKFLDGLATEVNVPVQEGKFSMENGKVKNFQPSQKGLELQVTASAAEINEKIPQVGIKEINLVVKETDPSIQMGDVNDLGISELIGEGHSNFKGSPNNRRHNITVGANSLNGILIKPDEEFSLVKTLGKIEASTGYLPELVIKGNKTVPEYGGGLCQIGTTTFRAALDTGLPITARTNHSYRVSYYEPAGTDATIYDPNPDLRFINDTGHYILFTTEMKGDDLYFRFYGTKDGRKVTQTTPRVFNYVSPGAKKIVETTDLKPGQTKCTEKAHVGADTEFTRTIVYANSTKKVDVFKSHYKPWREVCLVGVKELSKPATQ